MQPPIDDILLTAFALGELDDDAAEHARIERHIASDAAAARLVAEVQSTAEMLTDGFIAAPDVGLTAIQYAGIERRLAADAAGDLPHPLSLPIRRNWALWGSVAASMFIVMAVSATVLPRFWQGMPGNGNGAGKGTPANNPTANNSGDNEFHPTITFPHMGDGGETGGAAGLANTDSSDWPILRTSAGGLPWPAVVVPDTRLHEPAFVVAGDFPLAVIPPTPAYPDSDAKQLLSTIKTSLDAGRLPAPQSIRSDVLVNAVRYDDAPTPNGPVSATIESAVCPWDSGHLLVRVTVRTTGKDIAPPIAQDAVANDPPAPSLVPLVRDLRLSVEVNPTAAAGYRVIGYENAPSSWGEWSGRTDNLVMPAGRTFTALLEVVPTGQTLPASTVPAVRKYRKAEPIVVTSTELLTVAVEYGQGPMAEPARIDLPISIEARAIELASPEFRTAAAAAALGMSLRHSQPYSEPTLAAAVKLLSDVTATEPTEDRLALLEVAKRIEKMNPNPPSDAPMPGPFEKDDGTQE